MNAKFDEYDSYTNILFIIVNKNFTDKHRSLLNKYLKKNIDNRIITGVIRGRD
jgi:hypothetical protein